MEEYQIWTMFNQARQADAIVGIMTILMIWLALRVANMTRSNPESDTTTKIVSTAFGVLVILGTFRFWTISAINWTLTAGAFSQLDESSEAAKGFIDYVGTTDTATTPTPMAMLFLTVVAIMILSLIWRPKK
jgi:hypothetical protein|tara:strand:+ start:1069 stop:1464 length:396 start_codon:yes stop_codon:yes gene_type:complete